jgi:CheY-like chemotaxis protein
MSQAISAFRCSRSGAANGFSKLALSLSNPRRTRAHDGEEAIARLGTAGFDLVLLDVMMPKVDGYQVLTWIKDQARLRDVPAIMISALNEMNSVIRCIELGAVDYLLKR